METIGLLVVWPIMLGIIGVVVGCDQEGFQLGIRLGISGMIGGIVSEVAFLFIGDTALAIGIVLVAVGAGTGSLLQTPYALVKGALIAGMLWVYVVVFCQQRDDGTNTLLFAVLTRGISGGIMGGSILGIESIGKHLSKHQHRVRTIVGFVLGSLIGTGIWTASLQELP